MVCFALRLCARYERNDIKYKRSIRRCPFFVIGALCFAIIGLKITMIISSWSISKGKHLKMYKNILKENDISDQETRKEPTIEEITDRVTYLLKKGKMSYSEFKEMTAEEIEKTLERFTPDLHDYIADIIDYEQSDIDESFVRIKSYANYIIDYSPDDEFGKTYLGLSDKELDEAKIWAAIYLCQKFQVPS